MSLDFHVFTLFSGSRGNGVYVSCGNDALLVDAGYSATAVRRALQCGGASVSPQALFITHEHSDHTKGVEILSREMDVHMTEGSAPYIKCAPSHSRVHTPVFTQSVGGMQITSFVTPHDSHQSVGYLIESDCHTLGIATDLGYMPDSILEKLCGCDSVILESNHDRDLLMRGPYPPCLKERILSDRGHLSNAACAETVRTLAQNGVQNILLAHLSDENNTPTLAFRASDNALSALPHCKTRLGIADKKAPTRLL